MNRKQRRQAAWLQRHLVKHPSKQKGYMQFYNRTQGAMLRMAKQYPDVFTVGLDDGGRRQFGLKEWGNDVKPVPRHHKEPFLKDPHWVWLLGRDMGLW